MKISEKQIMQLMQIAQDAKNIAIERKTPGFDNWAASIATLIDTINNQQSEELKDIE